MRWDRSQRCGCSTLLPAPASRCVCSWPAARPSWAINLEPRLLARALARTPSLPAVIADGARLCFAFFVEHGNFELARVATDDGGTTVITASA